MDKYRRVIKKQESPKDGEIRVATRGRVSLYIAYATKLLLEEGHTKFVIRATGQALAKAVQIAELVKRRVPDLHQVTELGTLEVEDEFEPIEEGLDRVTEKRPVSFLHITISKEPLDKTAIGYQKPLPTSMVEELEDASKLRSRNKKGGKGKQEKGKEEDGTESSAGKQKGKGNDTGRQLDEDDDFYERPEVTTPRKGKGGKGAGKGKKKGKGKGKGKAKGKDGEEVAAEN